MLSAARESHRTTPFSTVTTRANLGRYRGYVEMLDSIDRLVERGAELYQVGNSVQGRPLFALNLGAPPSPKTSTTVILSGVHPTEWIGIESHLTILERLVGTDLGNRSVFSFPIVNPDGVFRVEKSLRSGSRRFVRHNARGVDLNRNFDVRWGERSIAQLLLSWMFRPGARAASEPEVEAIAHALARRRVDRALSFHSFGGAVLYPSAATFWPIHDAGEHQLWARRIAKAAADKPYRATSCAWFSMGATAGGLELDWFHERHGALSLLVECSRHNYRGGPSRWFQPFAWFNPRKVEQEASQIATATIPFVKGLSL